MLYEIARFIVWLYFKIYHRFASSGAENIPAGRPVILASNHASYLDPPAVALGIYPRHLRFVAWEKLFEVPIFGWLIRALGAVPVSPDNKNSSAALLRLVMGFLKDGSSVFICPEGHRTETGELEPLEGGVAILAMKTGTPVIPTWCGGTFRAMSPAMTFPRPRKVYVNFGKPIYMEEIPAELGEKEKRRYILDKIEEYYKKMDAEDKKRYPRQQLKEK